MNEYWQLFIQQVLLNAIPLLVPVIIGVVVKLLTSAWAEIKQWKPDVADEMHYAAKFAVAAAEQVGLSGALKDLANSKLDYAIEMAEKYLAEKGIKYIDLDLLRAAIEAQVLAQFPKKAE
jgi:hypothetical protein